MLKNFNGRFIKWEIELDFNGDLLKKEFYGLKNARGIENIVKCNSKKIIAFLY